MSNNSNRTTLSAERSEKSVALMLKYIEGELTGDLKLKVAKAVENCASCRNLYEELTEFFDPVKDLIYEVNYPAEIKRTDALFKNIFALTDSQSVAQPQDKLPHDPAEFELLDCLGCGA